MMKKQFMTLSKFGKCEDLLRRIWMNISLESLQEFVIMTVIRQIVGNNVKLLRNANVWKLLRFVKGMKRPLLSH
jgi:uncharacterized membrane protein